HTRKTVPLYRLPLSEACCAADCKPHRYDLSESILIKENHLTLSSQTLTLIQRAVDTKKKVIVEAKTIKFAKSLIDFKIDRILLDNFSPEMIKKFLSYKPKIKLEISGSINLKNINKYALDGIDYISIGDLTKNIKSKDLSMLIV
ncbi:MAG: nicotinate-nucleotide diphosphorylase, partial [Pseudomonadota bacterium]|nr:nicotinate-nucleotide diphosphorylase [Pseudomonadota bacterium]